MKRRGLVRFQIALLVVLVIIVIIRMIAGPPAPDGLVVFVDLEAESLRHAAFELAQPADIAVQVTGSLDEDAIPLALAAEGWIIRRADREVVWQMDPNTVERGRGSVARVPGDTLTLDAGIYDVYYASYGGADTHGRRRWRSEADQWQFVLRVVDEAVVARLLPDQPLEDLDAFDGHLVWKTAPMRNDQEKEHLFEVEQAAEFKVYAVGEIEDEPLDYAWIEDAATGERIWELTKTNTEPAGGLAGNRRFRGSVSLTPGAYRVVAKTNRRHAFGNWEGNPPYDPAGWGLSVYTTDAQAVSDFDPWNAREPIISLTHVPDESSLHQRFEVTQPIQVVLYCVGEITDRHGIYDYGELLKEEANRKRTIWKMSWDASMRAGGDQKNRLEVVFMRLDPGVYTLRYETDGSHAFNDWNADPPDYPERWGVSLFPVAPALDSGVVEMRPSLDDVWTTPAAMEPVSVTHVGEAIVAWTQLRGDVEATQVFELDRETTLHIEALGEITYSGQYDYGWIERDDTGERVWEMTLENTRHAGGTERNRRFDGVVTLPAGRYVVRYVTDGTHHFGAFSDEAPQDAENWGITIHYVATEQ